MISSSIRVRWNGQTHWIPYYQIKKISYQDLVDQIKTAFKDDLLLSYDLWVEEGQCVIHDDQSLRQAMEHNRADIDLVPKSVGQHSNPVPVIKPIVLRLTKEDSCKRKHWSSKLSMDTSVNYQSSVRLAPIKSALAPSPTPFVPLASASPHPFICNQVIAQGRICGQTFRRSYDLSRHQAIHLKNRPLSTCHQCGKKFTRMDALRRHQRVQGHHTPLKQSTWSPFSIHSRPARV